MPTGATASGDDTALKNARATKVMLKETKEMQAYKPELEGYSMI